jgi:hypothetical protein
VNARAGAVVGLPPSVAVKSGFRLPVVKLDRPPPAGALQYKLLAIYVRTWLSAVGPENGSIEYV